MIRPACDSIGPGRPVSMYVKVESFNPLASVKDRLALNIMKPQNAKSTCKPVKPWLRQRRVTPVLGLPWFVPPKVIRWSLPWPKVSRLKRRRLMRFLGAKVVLTPKEERGIGMYNTAKKSLRTMVGSLRGSLRTRRMPIFTNQQQPVRFLPTLNHRSTTG